MSDLIYTPMMLKEILKKNRRYQIEVAGIIGCQETQLSKYFNGWYQLPEKHLVNLMSYMLDEGFIEV